MRFLKKPETVPPDFAGLNYATKGHRAEIRKLLTCLQRGFCAYSERWLGEQLDSEEIEHFNDDLKDTESDGFFNWYAALRKLNQLKMGKHWSDWQPMPEPFTEDVQQRIHYTGGIFSPRAESDTPISNLIEFIGANDPKVVEDRRKHVDRLQWYKEVLSPKDFRTMFEHHPAQLSFPSALEEGLGIPAFDLIEQVVCKAAG